MWKGLIFCNVIDNSVAEIFEWNDIKIRLDMVMSLVNVDDICLGTWHINRLDLSEKEICYTWIMRLLEAWFHNYPTVVNQVKCCNYGSFQNDFSTYDSYSSSYSWFFIRKNHIPKRKSFTFYWPTWTNLGTPCFLFFIKLKTQVTFLKPAY